MKDVFIFSGTTEGRTLARWLASRGVMVHVRVATEYGAEVMEKDDNIDVKVGSCGGAEGIAAVIRDNMFSLVVDATHPYAPVVTENISAACRETGTEYLRLLRDGSAAPEDAVVVPDIAGAVGYLYQVEG